MAIGSMIEESLRFYANILPYKELQDPKEMLLCCEVPK